MSLNRNIIDNFIIKFSKIKPSIGGIKEFVNSCNKDFNIIFDYSISFEDYVDNDKNKIFSQSEAKAIDEIVDKLISFCNFNGLNIDNLINKVQNTNNLEEAELNMDGNLSSFRIHNDPNMFESEQPIQNHKFRTDQEVKTYRNRINKTKAEMEKEHKNIDNAIGAQKVWQVDALKENRKIHKSNFGLNEDLWIEPKENLNFDKRKFNNNNVMYLENDLNEELKFNDYMGIIYIYRISKYYYEVVLKSEKTKRIKVLYMELSFGGGEHTNYGPQNISEEKPEGIISQNSILCWDDKYLNETVQVDPFLSSSKSDTETFLNEIEDLDKPEENKEYIINNDNKKAIIKIIKIENNLLYYRVEGDKAEKPKIALLDKFINLIKNGIIKEKTINEDYDYENEGPQPGDVEYHSQKYNMGSPNEGLSKFNDIDWKEVWAMLIENENNPQFFINDFADDYEGMMTYDDLNFLDYKDVISIQSSKIPILYDDNDQNFDNFIKKVENAWKEIK